MSKFFIAANRRSAALYLAWEFGIGRARKMLAEAKAVPGMKGFIVLPHVPFADVRGRHTKKNTENWAARVKMIVGFQEGRLGRPLTGGDVYVRAA